MIFYDVGLLLFINYFYILNLYIVWFGFYNMCCDVSIRICIVVVKILMILVLYFFDYIKIRWWIYFYVFYFFYYSNVFLFDINRNVRMSIRKIIICYREFKVKFFEG